MTTAFNAKITSFDMIEINAFLFGILNTAKQNLLKESQSLKYYNKVIHSSHSTSKVKLFY